MNSYQDARLKSFNAIITEAQNKPLTVNMIPNFKKGIDRLIAIANELQVLRVEQETDRTGITRNKGNTQEDMLGLTLEVAGGVYSYAESINDFEMMAKVNYTTGVIPDMNQGEMVTAAEIVLAEAKKVPPLALAEEGISLEDLIELERLINLYKDVKPAPRVASVDRASVTERIRLLFLESTQLFRNKLDRLALQFKRKDLDFYLKYHAARNVIYQSAPSGSTTTE